MLQQTGETVTCRSRFRRYSSRFAHKVHFWKAVDPGAPQVLRGDGDCALRSVLLSALRLRAPARLDGAPRWPTAPLWRRLYVHS